MSVTFPAALHPLVQQVEAHVYAQPPLAIEAARALLKQCQQPEHLAYVYEQLGFAHLILGEHRLSCLFYEQARALQPQNIYVLANLAHARYELGEREQAVHIGREALRLKDEQACEAYKPEPAPLQAPFQGPLNLVSFSLYGALPRYCEMAVLNVLAVQRHLPGFVCRFYTDDSVPPAVLQRLQALGAQCVTLGTEGSRMPATFWRFLGMDDPQADCVLVRDVDALIDAREAWCVRDWQQSGQAFHILRDDCCHTELILAGLLGIRSGVLRGMRECIGHFLAREPEMGWRRYGDQLFLRHAIWPAVHAHTLTHDTVYGYGHQVHAVGYKDHPQAGPRNAFIGANHATCQLNCSVDQPLPPGARVVLSLTDAAGTLVCRHAMQAAPFNPSAPSGVPSHWAIQLPQTYADRVQNGQWRTEVAWQTHADGLGDGSTDPVLLGMQAT